MKVSPDTIREAFRYNPETGMVFWAPGRMKAGRPALTTLDTQGYLRGTIGGSAVAAHQVAFVLMMGRPANGVIDHINRDKTDNRWVNLRECSQSENLLNGSLRGGTSKYRGVSFYSGKWNTYFRHDRTSVFVGSFDTELEAARAYDAAVSKLDCGFRPLNFPDEAAQ